MEQSYYLKKQGGYYGPNHCGYVSDFINAGVYNIEEAKSECSHCADVSMHAIDMEAHNSEIDRRIKDLQRLKLVEYRP